jgi:hypothetical protein
MATTVALPTTVAPVTVSPTTTVTIEQKVLTDLHNGLHRIIYAHLGILVLLLALVGAGGYFGLKSYDKALAHAEALQTQYNLAQAAAVASQKQLTDLLAADAAQRAQESAQQASLAQQILKRDAQAPAPAIQTALQPSATAANVAKGLTEIYSDDKTFGVVQATPDGKVLSTVPQTQAMITSRLDSLRLSADLADTSKLYTLEQAKSSSLQTDLNSCKSTSSKDEIALADAQKTIKAYNKLVNRSKFKKILGAIGRNAERVGILFVGIELGHKL